MKTYYVYIMSSKSGVLYIGVTNDLERRTCEHKQGIVPGFSQKYRTKKLIYFESCNDALSAIAREKQLKRWRRSKKDALIARLNPQNEDLFVKLSLAP
ncbi:hypothetical protein A2V68_00030 [candidate division Kazan bacterium RBG_13_50_9]|uniref:GIY-YIG domain-containing protein n=1 Tax=candidate division Kazan bacterium RBG_13_50_9 TaxID=1798535 RepID=A0A1F4NR93_UNCK3|nr:MAG: hypothetical protein A2V68_00030 [candidate division Kazan bacterium RBG_13_50_9]